MLSSRLLLVVGKGGVGKSTSAAALALHLADEGLTTHLLSTDPAHSLWDLFGSPGPAGISGTRPCGDTLTLEELDAPSRADGWAREVREAVAELFDRGTYLDEGEVAAFLDHSLPGMDELMAALRIVELARSDEHDRIVVDTAPTGHTLRMLRSGETLKGWVVALDAMAAKAGAVGQALTGRRIRFAGERVMDQLAEQVARFDEAVRSDADFVVVTREGDVVAAETRRLVEKLQGQGMRVRAIVGVGGGAGGVAPPDVPVFTVPLGPAFVGCEGLRRWGVDPDVAGAVRGEGPGAPDEPPGAGQGRGGGAVHGASPVEPTAAEAAERLDGTPVPCAARLDALKTRELVFFAGKGGVGKSTCAAAFALYAAADREVLLLGLDPAGSLSDVLGRPIGADGRRFDRLEVRQLDADHELDRFRENYRRRVEHVFERLGLRNAVALDRRVVESILDMAPPGLDEVFAMDAILDGQDEHRLIVLDTAPTGHFLRLLAMPAMLLSWTRSVMRLLLRYRSALGLDDFANDLLRLAKRLRGLGERLADPERTAVVVVTLSELLPRLETGRLLSALESGGTPVAAVIENRWMPGETGRTSAFGNTDRGSRRTVRAPLLAMPPVGPDRLGGFLRQWACP